MRFARALFRRASLALVTVVAVAGGIPALAITAVPAMLDDAGRPKGAGYSAKRVVTLAPSLTEFVYAIGASEQLVGVSAYSDFPEGAKLKPQVADGVGVSFEALLALKPDLVLAWKDGTRSVDIARLDSLGINVFVLQIRALSDVPRVTRVIGKLLGRPLPTDMPERFAATFEAKLVNLQTANVGKLPVRMFFEISQLPLMTVNGQHFITETVRLCGGENVFSDVTQLVVEPSREELFKRGADAILRPASIHKGVARDKALYAGLAAYQRGRVYALNADWILRPGPRVLLAAEEICAALDRARMSMGADAKSKAPTGR
ncbi:MAG: helical backbone metal receptor [Usitatibacteraceae bacterium]